MELVTVVSCELKQTGGRLSVPTPEIDSLDLIIDKNSDDTTERTEQITQFPDIEASYSGGKAAKMKFVIEVGLQGRVYILCC